MTLKRRIAVFTATRAEYGLLRPLMQRLIVVPEIDAGFLVSGTHLLDQFGKTIEEIEADCFPIWAKIDGMQVADSAQSNVTSMAEISKNLSTYFIENKPDILVLLGDRYELLAAAQVAVLHRIPIVHIHGGEVTEGATDDSIRHAITKLAHLHFTATEGYRQRVIQLGEAPETVINTGALGVDNILSLDPIPDEELSADLGLDMSRPIFLITYHPETLADQAPRDSVRAMLDALENFSDVNFIFTHPNSDASWQEITQEIQAFVDQKAEQATLVKSLGLRRYLSLMKGAALVLGNSSSGILETPSFAVPTVNIGGRQKGRIRAKSVIDCGSSTDQILWAIQKALSVDFRQTLEGMDSPFGNGQAAEKIVKVLEAVSLKELSVKKFYDLRDRS